MLDRSQLWLRVDPQRAFIEGRISEDFPGGPEELHLALIAVESHCQLFQLAADGLLDGLNVHVRHECRREADALGVVLRSELFDEIGEGVEVVGGEGVLAG